MQIYQHLGSHEGIVTATYNLSNGTDNNTPSTEQFEPVISMPYMKNGTLQEYLSKKEPDENLKIRWTRSLAATVAFCHDKNVLLADIGSRNCLFADDLSLKLCDFGDSSIIPPDLELTKVNDNGVSVRTDIAQFGSVVYEISTRINLSDPRRPRLNFVDDQIKDMSYSDESESDEDHEGEGSGRRVARADDIECNGYQKSMWPRIEDLPCTEGILFGTIIYKCWTRAYQSMNQVSRDLTDYKEIMATRTKVGR